MINNPNTAVRPAWQVLSNHGFADICYNNITGQKSLHSTQSFKPGDVLCTFGPGMVLNQPTYLTVQTGIGVHITLNPEFLQYINHSCNPCVFFDTTTFELVCLSPIEPGDEFSFFYPSTEWDMVQPFNCHCGSSNCLHSIQGASYLSAEAIRQYRLTDFIQSQLKLEGKL